MQRDIEQSEYDASRLAHRLLRVWRGQFLPEIDQPIVSNKRTALTASLARTVEHLGSELEAMRLSEEAARLFRRAAELESAAENLQH